MPVGVVGVARPKALRDVAVVLAALVLVLRMSNAIGVPVVLPWYTPRESPPRPGSLRWVTHGGWCRAAAVQIVLDVGLAQIHPGGQPSITQPMAGPWDSPKIGDAKQSGVFAALPGVLPSGNGALS